MKTLKALSNVSIDGAARIQLREIPPPDTDPIVAPALEFVNRVTDVLVSKRYGGYYTTSLTDDNSGESVSLLLGESLTTIDELEGFREVIATPSISETVIRALFPRENVPLDDRKYKVTSDLVALAVKNTTSKLGAAALGPVQTSYVYVITRALALRNLVHPARDTRIVSTSKSFVLTLEAARRAIVVDALQGVMSDARIKMELDKLGDNATPLALGAALGSTFRYFSKSIPEVELKMEYFDIAVLAVRLYHLSPRTLPLELRANKSLQDLAEFANFILFSTEDDVYRSSLDGLEHKTIINACDATLLILRTSPSIQSIPMEQYASYFGEVPLSSDNGLKRGLILYHVQGQQSKMSVVDVYPSPKGHDVSELDPNYVTTTGVTDTLNRSLLTVGAMKGLANIIADDLNVSLSDQRETESPQDPVLALIQVSELDLTMLAMSKASTLSYALTPHVVEGGEAQVSLLYGITPLEHWRMSVMASSPTEVWTDDPAAVVLYSSSNVQTEPAPMPSRPQTLGVRVLDDTTFVGGVDAHLTTNVQEPYKLSLPLEVRGLELKALDIYISVLRHVVDRSGKAHDRGTAYYAAVLEPGVDSELETLLQIAYAYIESDDELLRHKAQSWLVSHVSHLMKNPLIRGLADRAINRALVEKKIDVRRFGAQMRAFYLTAYFGTTLAVLNRFGKLPNGFVPKLLAALPTQTLSAQATLLLADVPTAANVMPTVRTL